MTTKLFCGKCGKMMVGESGISQTGKIHYYYKCGDAKRKRGCKKKAAKKDWIERATVLYTVNRVLQDDEISRIAECLVALQDKDDLLLPPCTVSLPKWKRAVKTSWTRYSRAF